ncbi:MAG: response regulator transcription factor, partial [Bacteroidetes bacterium]|nr:response regulator transcription factor [Bacteroidota bacterium]
VQILGEANGVVEGVKLIRKVKPNLVFLDIEMGDGNGFDLLEIFGEIDFQVIFITGMDAYAIQAFKYSAVDYLLKPVDPEDLQAAVERATERVNSQGQANKIELLLENINEQMNAKKRLALHSRDKVDVVEINDIVRCESDDNYTRFFIANGKKILVSKTLKEYDNLLSDHGFLRIHQSHLINPQHIVEFVKADGGHLLMKDGKEAPVSHRKREVVTKYLEGLA